MEKAWRPVLVIYNFLLLFLAGVVVVAAVGRAEPLDFINQALSTPQNRVIVGTVAIIVIAVALVMIVSGLKYESKPDSIIVDSSLAGQVSITVPAIKVIIMKAVKKVDGVKEIKPAVSSSNDGLVIYLHTAINPDHNVPEMSKNLQQTVKEYLEDIGGLQVSQVKVLIDDFSNSNKAVSR
ncbi:MAG: alkaline shock response membrane anchor protein AmaP [Syntrophomonas sp.]|uniref:alkaline shock response membrane anchor protein AmaP n=1 Tax=Syntrophomonas sp. TaxID=2053627 RepID=UPI002632A226|nr:alkaline shock response membrane anchor protein AmaP [Syntrophomonas sp.]MDD2510249.1 alkaline shock response membrane anchor protein AmaP [Syntrophomonas sp.]MDD4626833.1 alkaline shock response membrane anchor protein AmaP [Syntrophomonas sp.]